MKNYLIASSKSWFYNHPKSAEFSKLNINYIFQKDDLTLEKIVAINPRYIFFPHWSWPAPEEIFERYDCIAFHTAPLPYGRGGSPIQNLITRGHSSSPVNALKMTGVLDGGPIYMSEIVSLSGNVEEIFQRISIVVEKMIISICTLEPIPTAQQGEPFIFKRLSETDNLLLGTFDITEMYDRIRMVDGLDYPRAYIDFSNFKLLFSKAHLENGVLSATVTFIPK